MNNWKLILWIEDYIRFFRSWEIKLAGNFHFFSGYGWWVTIRIYSSSFLWHNTQKKHSKTFFSYDFHDETVMIFSFFRVIMKNTTLIPLVFFIIFYFALKLNHACLTASIQLRSVQKPAERKFKDCNTEMFRQMAFDVNTCGYFWWNGHQLLTQNIVLTGNISVHNSNL